MAFAPILEKIGFIRPLNILPAVLIPLFILRYGKKWITVPRMGLVRFGPSRKRDKKRLRIFATVLFIITILQVILTITGAFPPSWMTGMGKYSVPIIISLFTVLVFCVFAYFKDFPRLALIGLLFAAGILLSEYLHYETDTAHAWLIGLGIPGVIVLIMGTILLRHFLKKYPKPEETEVYNGSR
jgi:hypothetical protein